MEFSQNQVTEGMTPLKRKVSDAVGFVINRFNTEVVPSASEHYRQVEPRVEVPILERTEVGQSGGWTEEYLDFVTRGY